MNTQTVCILRDARPGHYNQSVGALDSLPESMYPRVFIDIPAPRKALKTPLLLLMLAAGRNKTLMRLAWKAYYGVPVPDLSPACLLISTGGDTLLGNIALGRIHDIPNAYIGKRSPGITRGINLLFTGEGQAVPGRVHVLDFGPARIPSPPPPPPQVPPRLAAVLIGGDCEEYRYRPDDYAALAGQLASMCAKHRMQLLLTTSRRTGPDAERLLREKLPAQLLQDSVWYAQSPRPVLNEFCSRADLIMCSEDSASMLTEAIHFGRPVLSFRPREKSSNPGHDKILRSLARRGVAFGNIESLADIDISALPIASPGDHDVIAAAIHSLIAHGKTGTP